MQSNTTLLLKSINVFPFSFSLSFLFLIFAIAICPPRLWYTLRCAEPLKQGATYWKALLTLCFWTFETTTIEQRTKTNARVTPRGVYIRLRSVLREYLYPHKHTLRCIYILQRGCFSVCLITRAVVGLEQRTGRCKHPRFSLVVIKIIKSIWLWGACQNK